MENHPMPKLPAFDARNERFAIPGIARIVAGNGGLPKVQITSPAAWAEIYLHGAQLTSWFPQGSGEVIFLSEHSRWEEGRAIRGGIPVCFPWFRAKTDDPKAPAHGFARTRSWQLESLTQEQDSVVLALSTESDEDSRKWWPYQFRLVYRISVGKELKLELTVSNTGMIPFRFEEALHTYNQVGDAESLHITGLDGVLFLDNRDSNREKQQHGEFAFTAATDNAYIDTQNAVEIVDPELKRRIRLQKQGSQTTVVWNPWSDGAVALADLGRDEWRQMACVEASNILGNAVTLAPGAQHTLTAILSVISE
jgi:glucose-6-phosphate 1-epimerase